ncbi:MAG: methyltransferase domain-containing protein [Armatimonadetes bacterium]|nr:methyltransferase domain-containing protein [Armatimonadota bacterium]
MTIEAIDFGRLYRDHLATTARTRKTASAWDSRAAGMASKALNSRYAEEFVARMDLQGATSLLDVGCGPGTIGLAVAHQLQCVVGLDYSSAMLGAMRAKAAEMQLANVETLHCAWEDDWSDVPECDIVVVTAPLTASTVGLIGAAQLACLKPGALLVNVGRGLVVDTDALLRALDEGRLAGAALDVVDPSPLPEDHPLWEHPKVLLTCHTAKSGSNFGAAQFETVLENVRRYVRGEPLQNIVQPDDWC